MTILTSAVALGALAGCASDTSDRQAQRKANVESTAAFCRSAAHFRLGQGELLSPAERRHHLTTLRSQVCGPEELLNYLEEVLKTFETRLVDKSAKRAGVMVGEFIEATCPHINIGGAR